MRKSTVEKKSSSPEPRKSRSWDKENASAPSNITLANQLIFFTSVEGTSLAFTKEGFVPSEGLAPYLRSAPAGGFQKDDVVLDMSARKWKILQRLIEPTLAQHLPPRIILVIDLV